MFVNLKNIFVALFAALALAGCASSGYNHGYYQSVVYGTVSNVQYVPARGSDGATAAGYVAGGVAGGLIGHQIGKGRGRTAATIVGAMGGALLGGAIAQGNAPHYLVTVRLDDGSVRQVRSRHNPGLHVGQRVTMNGRQMYR